MFYKPWIWYLLYRSWDFCFWSLKSILPFVKMRLIWFYLKFLLISTPWYVWDCVSWRIELPFVFMLEDMFWARVIFKTKSICIKVHLPIRRPLRQCVQIMLKSFGIKVFDDFLIDDTTISEQADVGQYVVRQIIYEFNKNSKGPKTVP